MMQREPQAEVEITDCTGEPLPEEIPLPPEPPDIEIGETLPPEPPCETSYNNPEEDPEYLQAMAALYGEKKADGQLWGKKSRVHHVSLILLQRKSATLLSKVPLSKLG